MRWFARSTRRRSPAARSTRPIPSRCRIRIRCAGRDNVIINPHAAWYSEQAMVGLQTGAPTEVQRVLTGQWPVNVVNKAVKNNNRAGL